MLHTLTALVLAAFLSFTNLEPVVVTDAASSQVVNKFTFDQGSKLVNKSYGFSNGVRDRSDHFLSSNDRVVAHRELNLADTSEGRTKTLPELIEQWSPYVYRVQCSHWLIGTTRGSGTLVGDRFLTNQHVTMPGECFAESPRDAFTFTEKDIEHPYAEKDFSVVRRFDDDRGSSKDVRASREKRHGGTAAPDRENCPDVPARGSPIIILGFPYIGSTSGATVTQGIVSGYDGDFLITDAKIEEGNSGGAAIDVERNCFLGIPTASKIGRMESLGRILIVR